jgi:hypothetical protein
LTSGGRLKLRAEVKLPSHEQETAEWSNSGLRGIVHEIQSWVHCLHISLTITLMMSKILSHRTSEAVSLVKQMLRQSARNESTGSAGLICSEISAFSLPLSSSLFHEHSITLFASREIHKPVLRITHQSLNYDLPLDINSSSINIEELDSFYDLIPFDVTAELEATLQGLWTIWRGYDALLLEVESGFDASTRLILFVIPLSLFPNESINTLTNQMQPIIK